VIGAIADRPCHVDRGGRSTWRCEDLNAVGFANRSDRGYRHPLARVPEAVRSSVAARGAEIRPAEGLGQSGLRAQDRTPSSDGFAAESGRCGRRGALPSRLDDLDADGAQLLDGLCRRLGCHARCQIEQHPRGKPASGVARGAHAVVGGEPTTSPLEPALGQPVGQWRCRIRRCPRSRCRRR